MPFKHACFEPHAATATRPLTVAKERAGRTREESALFLAHAAQGITSGTADLLDFALKAQSLDDLEPLLLTVRDLRQRVDAITTRALQRMDELCK